MEYLTFTNGIKTLSNEPIEITLNILRIEDHQSALQDHCSIVIRPQ